MHGEIAIRASFHQLETGKVLRRWGDRTTEQEGRPAKGEEYRVGGESKGGDLGEVEEFD